MDTEPCGYPCIVPGVRVVAFVRVCFTRPMRDTHVMYVPRPIGARFKQIITILLLQYGVMTVGRIFDVCGVLTVVVRALRSYPRKLVTAIHVHAAQRRSDEYCTPADVCMCLTVLHNVTASPDTGIEAHRMPLNCVHHTVHGSGVPNNYNIMSSTRYMYCYRYFIRTMFDAFVHKRKHDTVRWRESCIYV